VDARLAKIMPGRKARFAGRDPHCQSADAGQSGLAWPVFAPQRPVPTSSGKQRPLRKSVVERFAALTREDRTFGKPVCLRRPVTFGGQSHFVRLVPFTPGKKNRLDKKRCAMEKHGDR